jgi:hypothetical protein
MNERNHKSVEFDFNVGKMSSPFSFLCSAHAFQFQFSIAIFYVHIIPNAFHVVKPFHRFDMKKKKKRKETIIAKENKRVYCSFSALQ